MFKSTSIIIAIAFLSAFAKKDLGKPIPYKKGEKFNLLNPQRDECDTSTFVIRKRNFFKSEHEFRVAICIFWVSRIVKRVEEGNMGRRWGQQMVKSLVEKDTVQLFRLGKIYKDSIIDCRRKLLNEIPAPIYHLHALSVTYYCKMLSEVDIFINKLHKDPYMKQTDFITNVDAMADAVRPLHLEIAQELKNLKAKYKLDEIDLDKELGKL